MFAFRYNQEQSWEMEFKNLLEEKRPPNKEINLSKTQFFAVSAQHKQADGISQLIYLSPGVFSCLL